MRKVCVYTSTRADYGLLRNLIKEIYQDQELLLQLLVSGAHLVPSQGLTIKEIQSDGFEPDKSIDINLHDDSREGICKSMGIAVFEYGKFFAEFEPDVLLLLGDRFETFCCAAAAQVCRIPVAHIHGGETTQGAIDEAFRHSITKMAHLHFPCCEVYQNRILQMGESSAHVYNVGSLGVENIRNIDLMNREKLEESIQFKLDRPFFLVTFHPVTLDQSSFKKQFEALLVALENYPDHKFIFTGSNTDPGGQMINQMQHEFKKRYPDQCFVISSLGYLRYLSAMKLCDAVIGNSSSGILEAPALSVPTINIGDRQNGRIRTKSIVDCNLDKGSIILAIEKIYSRSFKSNIQKMDLPFEKANTSKMIKKIVQQADLRGILKKKFNDMASESILDSDSSGQKK